MVGLQQSLHLIEKKTTGNPVIFGKNYFKQLCFLNGDKGGKEILDKNPENLVDRKF